MALLTFQHVSKTYDNVTKALQDVSFSIEEGEFVSIIGPSGAGKSTLLRCVNRLVDASQGAIFFDGQNVTTADKKQLREIRIKTAMIFQHYNLVDRLSVVENVLHGRLGQKSTLSGVVGQYTEEEKAEASASLRRWALPRRPTSAATSSLAGRNSAWALHGR